MTSSTTCVNDANAFCYTCGQFTIKENRMGIDDFYKKAYFAYFKVKLDDQDKPWAPHYVCNTCKEHIRQWTNGKRKSLSFGIHMIWRAASNHHDDCCFFVAPNLYVFNKKNRKSTQYPSLPSAIWPTSHDEHIPVPIFKGLLEEDDYESPAGSSSSDEYEISNEEFDSSSTEPQCFSQSELRDLVRDLELPKESAEVLASCLKGKNLLESGTLVAYYRNRDAEFSRFFKQSTDLLYCKDPEQVLLLGVGQYNASDWRLLIDSSKQSLKCFLLRNTIGYASIPIGNSTTLKEKHQPIKEVIEKINYTAHN